jgi:glucose-1-phosphate adenylyltransferase
MLAGDQLYRMNYTDLIEAHIDRQADITIAAQPVTAGDAPHMGIFRFDREGQIVAFEEKPDAARLGEIRQSIPAGGTFGHTPDKPFIASMGIYLFSREALLEVINRDNTTDFGKGVIPNALNHYRVHAHLFRGYWADVGTVGSFYDANLMLTRADYYETDDLAPARGSRPRIGIGRDVVLDRVIVDKNARIGDGAQLVNEAGVQEADGDGYYIRSGVIIVPRDGVIPPGVRI